MIQDFLNILLRSIYNLTFKELWTTILIGIILAVLCWVVCNYYTRLWNKKYHLTFTHHVLCGVAGLFTFLFVITFSGLIYLKEVSIVILNVWSTQILNDNEWAANTFQTAFYKVKENGLENFENIPLPGKTGSHIPVNNKKSKEQCAIIYTSEACNNFDKKYPFLSKIIWTSSKVPEEVIKKDMYEYFKTNPAYPPQRAIELASNYIKEGLIQQTPRVVTFARLILIVLFIFVQLIPFGLIGYSAYRDIKTKF
jgi:hypothetical protein